MTPPPPPPPPLPPPLPPPSASPRRGDDASEAPANHAPGRTRKLSTRKLSSRQTPRAPSDLTSLGAAPSSAQNRTGASAPAVYASHRAISTPPRQSNSRARTAPRTSDGAGPSSAPNPRNAYHAREQSALAEAGPSSPPKPTNATAARAPTSDGAGPSSAPNPTQTYHVREQCALVGACSSRALKPTNATAARPRTSAGAGPSSAPGRAKSLKPRAPSTSPGAGPSSAPKPTKSLQPRLASTSPGAGPSCAPKPQKPAQKPLRSSPPNPAPASSGAGPSCAPKPQKPTQKPLRSSPPNPAPASPGGGEPVETPESANLRQHIARLELGNVAVAIPGFARGASATPLELAVVAAVAARGATTRYQRRNHSRTGAMAPAQGVVALVRSPERADQLRALLTKHSAERVALAPPPAPAPRDGEAPQLPPPPPRTIASFFGAFDVVVARTTHALDELRAGRLALRRVSLLLFDEAERSASAADPASALMREFYRGLPRAARVRVLAVAGVRQGAFAAEAVAAHLFAPFARAVGAPVAWANRLASAELDASLADVEFVKFRPGSARAAGAPAQAAPDVDVLYAELGEFGVAVYQTASHARLLAAEYAGNPPAERVPWGSVRELYTVHGLSHKACCFVDILYRAHAAATVEDRLMAVVFSGRPVVAVGLLALLRHLRGFEAVVPRVVLGDAHSARPFLSSFSVTAPRGFQGEQSDDEAVDDFGVGDAHVLLVASENQDVIDRSRRPIPPAPLVIRFDGSLADPEHDGGGGRCQVFIFREDHGRKDHGRHGRKAVRKARQSSGGRHDEPMPEFGGADDVGPDKDAAGDEEETPRSMKTSNGAPPALREAQDADEAANKRKRESGQWVQLKSPRFSKPAKGGEGQAEGKKSRGRREDKDCIARTVQQPQALIGPQVDKETECYLYGLRLQEARDGLTVGKEEREILNPGGIENYGVLLTRKLKSRDLTFSIGDLGLQCRVDSKVGTIGLVYLGAVTLSKSQMLEVREFMTIMFSAVLKEFNVHSFNWEGFLKQDGTSAAKCPTYYRQYLVVPVFREKDGEGKVSGDIDWSKMSRIEQHHSSFAERRDLKHFHPPKQGGPLTKHCESLESNLICLMRGPGMLLTGSLRYDLCPLQYTVTSKAFDLNDDGSFKPNDLIQFLYNTEESKDPEGLVEKCPMLPCNAATQDDDAISPHRQYVQSLTHGSGSQIFSPYRNRLKKRDRWIGNIVRSFEDIAKDDTSIQVKGLDQPMLPTVRVPQLTMSHLVESLRDVRVKSILEDVVEGAKGSRYVVPELCSPHPITVGAMFLPPCLLALERHVLLCELRDMFTEKVGVPIDLRLLAQAVTSYGVDPAECYERLEFLGDSVLKLSSTVRIFTKHSHFSEGKMHVERANMVSNEALRQKADKAYLINFLCFNRLNTSDWKPPGCDRGGRVVVLNQKSLADVVEALCGVLYLSGARQYHWEQNNVVDIDAEEVDNGLNATADGSGSLTAVGSILVGYEKGVKMLEEFLVFKGKEPSHQETLLSAIHSLHPAGSPKPTEIIPEAFPRDPRLARPKQPWDEEFGPLEAILGYKFKRRHLLMCALTHGSYIDKSFESRTMTETFQRMEFLGDAVLDFCVVLFLYSTYPEMGPGDLTDMKGRIVSNETFARVSIRHGLNKFLFMRSEALLNQIKRFEDVMNEEKQIGDAMLYFEDVSNVAAPKVLGDVFESILGAILVDSGLEAVWNVAMRLLAQPLRKRASLGMEDFHPTRKLRALVSKTLRITPTGPRYSHRIVKSLDPFECDVYIVGDLVATAGGTSKKRAQLLAAKKAYERFVNPPPGSKDAKLIAELTARATKLAAESLKHVR